MKMLTKWMTITALAGGALLAAQGAPMLTPLYSFDGTSGHKDPVAGLIKGSDGNYYGTTWQGGNYHTGSVFRYSPTTGVLTNLYSFDSTNGAAPYAGLTDGNDGFLYGSTTAGGTFNNGTLFRINRTTGVFTNLYSFGNGNDGSEPYGELELGGDGKLYGTTAGGGASDFGTVFVWDPATWTYAQIKAFSATGTDGGWPYGALCRGPSDTTGNVDTYSGGNPNYLMKRTITTHYYFYGTTWGGGGSLEGSIFQFVVTYYTEWDWSPTGVLTVFINNRCTYGTPTTLYSFTGGLDGANPYAGLMLAPDGNYYGTTVHGGTNDWGGIFRIAVGGAFTRVFSLGGGSQGANPYSPLVAGLGAGNLFGTTLAGGIGNNGTIYKLTTSGLFTNMYNFTGIDDGGSPYAGLMSTAPGVFCGTVGAGGAHGLGEIFKFMPDAATVAATATPPEGGTVTGAGTYLGGALVWLYAVASSNFDFMGWSDGLMDNPRAVTVPSTNISFTALFQATSEIAMQASPVAGGTVLGSGRFPTGLVHQVSAAANPGWVFAGWNDSDISNPRTIIVPATNITYTALFTQQFARLSVRAVPASGGVVNGGGNFPIGSTQQISVTPTNGWLFGSWQDGDTNSLRLIVLTSNDVIYTASLVQPSSLITLNVNTNAGGMVVGAGSYAGGTTQSVFAVANAGWMFSQWLDGSIDNPRLVVMTGGDINLTALFVPAARITINSSPAGAGTLSGGGSYRIGQTATLRATANAGWLFTGWSSGGVPKLDNPLSVLVGGNEDYVANFLPSSVTVTVRGNPDAGGSASGSGVYAVGSTQMITAAAISGWSFTNWSDGATANPRYLIVPQNNITILANFMQTGVGTATINVQSTPPNGASLSGGGVFTVGSSVLISAAPSNGWTFISWSDGDGNLWRYVTVPAAGATYTAVLAPTMRSVSVTASPSFGGVVSGAGRYRLGTNVTLTATPASGWTFTGWSDGLVANPRLVTVLEGGGSYTAAFRPTLGAALGLPAFGWATGGNAEWFGEYTTAHDGTTAAQSGAIGNGQSSWLQTITNGPGSLLFWWKVSSEANHDYLSFIVDGATTNRISGNVGWTQYACFVGAGTHTFKWEYAKDGAGAAGADAGYLDGTAWLSCPAATNTPLMYFQENNGLLASWVLNSNGTHRFTRILANINGWQLKTAGDVDGDGTSDLLLQTPFGDVRVWFMTADGTGRSTFLIPNNIGSWDIRACSDWNADLRSEIFFQNAAGAVAYWLIDTNGVPTNSAFLGNMGAWRLQAAADLDNDQKAELFWQTPAGNSAVWFHTNSTIRAQVIGNMGAWAIRGAMDNGTNGPGSIAWQATDSTTASWFVNTNAVPTAVVPYGKTGTWKLKAVGR